MKPQDAPTGRAARHHLADWSEPEGFRARWRAGGQKVGLFVRVRGPLAEHHPPLRHPTSDSVRVFVCSDKRGDFTFADVDMSQEIGIGKWN